MPSQQIFLDNFIEQMIVLDPYITQQLNKYLHVGAYDRIWRITKLSCRSTVSTTI